jgi:hypothetical protein
MRMPCLCKVEMSALWMSEDPMERNPIRSGVPRRFAMKISGHLTGSTFKRYNIVDSTDLQEAMAKVEK